MTEAKIERLNAAHGTAALRERAMPLLFAVVTGMGLLFVAGYAQATVLHDAAHDQRHAMAFPCH